MLKTMRHHAKYFYILFFIIILTFLFWGVGTVDKSDITTIVAEVGTQKIPLEEFWRIHDRTFAFYRDLYKEKFDEEMQKKMKLKEKVLEALVDSRVMLLAAQQNGLTISDTELSEAITNDPAFMKNGVFDAEIYRNRLRLERMTVEGYESLKRKELLVEKFRRLIELSAAEAITLPENLKADEQVIKSLREQLMAQAKEKAVRAYLDGFKQGIQIKIYQDRIS